MSRDLESGPPGHDGDERRRNRRMMIVAAALAGVIVGMWVIGTWWSFVIGVLASVVATEWDRRERPGAHEVPLWAFLATVFVVLFLVAAVVVFVAFVIAEVAGR